MGEGEKMVVMFPVILWFENEGRQTFIDGGIVGVHEAQHARIVESVDRLEKFADDMLASFQAEKARRAQQQQSQQPEQQQQNEKTQQTQTPPK